MERKTAIAVGGTHLLFPFPIYRSSHFYLQTTCATDFTQRLQHYYHYLSMYTFGSKPVNLDLLAPPYSFSQITVALRVCVVVVVVCGWVGGGGGGG
jgi:hypothetical protein